MRSYKAYRWKDVLDEYTSQTFFFMSMMKREQDETIKANNNSGESKNLNGGFIGG